MEIQPYDQHEKPGDYIRDEDNNSPVSQELFSELENDPQKREKTAMLRNLGNFLYDTNTQTTPDFCEYVPERPEYVGVGDLYTIIKYEGKDLLVKMGSGKFSAEVFKNPNIPELKGLSITPIPLFVLEQGYEDKAFKDSPKKYLDKYAVIVVPKKGHAYSRSSLERDNKPIQRDDIHIRHYSDAIDIIKTAILHKKFSNKGFAKCVQKIKKLQDMTLKRFTREIKKDRGNQENPDLIMITLIECLMHMDVPQGIRSDEDNIKSMYDLIQTFDIREKKFLTVKHN